MKQSRTVVVTGATGFVGSRLVAALTKLEHFEVLSVKRDSTLAEFESMLIRADVIVHLAGVTRPGRPEEFTEGNINVTKMLTDAMRRVESTAPLIFSSSVRAVENTLYGTSKLAAERELIEMSHATGGTVSIFRLGQIFGEGAKPRYNSIVATLLSDKASGLTTPIERPGDVLDLLSIDDVIASMLKYIEHPPRITGFLEVKPSYRATVGDIAKLIAAFDCDYHHQPHVDDNNGLQAALFRAFQGYHSPIKSN